MNDIVTTTQEPQRIVTEYAIPRSIFAMSGEQFNRLSVLAKMYAASSFNSGKKSLTENDYFLIMLKGIELGMSPTLAVDFINIIQGKPCIDGKGMLALIYASGLLEDITIDSQEEYCTITGKRKGLSVHSETFTKADAIAMKSVEWVNNQSKQIPLWDKSTWQNQRRVMLKWRCVSAWARAYWSDVIGGLYTPDEMGADVIVHDDGRMDIVPSKPALQAPQPQQAQPQLSANTENSNTENTNTETNMITKWYDEHNAIAKVIAWAKGKGYGDDEQSLKNLLGTNWDAFQTGREACNAIQSKHEELVLELAPKPADTPAEPETEAPVQTGEFIAKIARHSRNIAFMDKEGFGAETALYFKGRTELSKLVGETYANANAIALWDGTDGTPKTYPIAPLRVIWEMKPGKSYRQVVSVSVVEDTPLTREQDLNKFFGDAPDTTATVPPTEDIPF